MTLKALLLVGSGGFLGAVSRYLISGAVHAAVRGGSAFPLGTLTVNVIGCLGIGLLAGLTETRQLLAPEARLFLMIGLLGGFTTFSTFGYEGFALLRDGEHVRLLAYAGLHLLLGLVAVWAGHALIVTRG